jgi:hypothetical protein
MRSHEPYVHPQHDGVQLFCKLLVDHEHAEHVREAAAGCLYNLVCPDDRKFVKKSGVLEILEKVRIDMFTVHFGALYLCLCAYAILAFAFFLLELIMSVR